MLLTTDDDNHDDDGHVVVAAFLNADGGGSGTSFRRDNIKDTAFYDLDQLAFLAGLPQEQPK